MLVNLPSLELLDLSECENLTDATVKAIVFHCRMLRSLSVAGCYRVCSLLFLNPIYNVIYFTVD